MTNPFNTPTRELRPQSEVTANVAEEDILSAEDVDPEELEITRHASRFDAETRRASPDLVGRYLSRVESDPADELEFDRELELPQPELPAHVIDTPAASAPTLDDLLDDAMQKCVARQAESIKALEPPVCDPPQAIRPRADRGRSRLLRSTLVALGGAALGVGLALALLRLLS